MARLSGDVLVVNAGSTSLKLNIVHEDGTLVPVGSLAGAPKVGAVGHRVVHGGSALVEPVVVDDDVLAELHALEELAPLHNVPAVQAIEAARSALPHAVQVAVFDTAFHATIPAMARTYALPARFRELGVRRFGFHGISVQGVAEHLRVSRLVVCHLGGGASVTAVADGRSIDTTMGFTPLEGVPMGTRAGSVDPGALLYLLRHGVSVDELDQALEHESGLVGLAGTEDVAALERAGTPDSELALGVYCYRIAQAVAAMATALGGIDALAFTAGVGTGSALVRAEVCGRLDHLGVRLDTDANRAAHGDAEIGDPSAPVRVAVVTSREEQLIAGAARLLAGAPR